MHNLPDLISDLALITIVAGIVTIVFKWLKQPAVLGYIVAGFLVSSGFLKVLKKVPNENFLNYLNYYPQVSDIDNISTWAEFGVIFLLFALGIEFSFKRLMEVKGTASIATFINMSSMIVVGYLVGRLLGWTNMDSLFLGVMLSISSTTILVKAFKDLGLQKKKFVGIVFGMLIVEDLSAILMLVILPTIAISRNLEGAALLNSVLKLAFFMFIWFVVGIYIIPTLLKKLKTYLNDETLLIVTVGLCLGMVMFASAVGFSTALGAFMMGAILAETIEAKHIEVLVEPIKNLFGAVFFVSVGMMIDPVVIVQYIVPIFIIILVVMVMRTTFATLGVSASGQGLKVAMQAGFCFAQVGEFSFIIATLGMSLGVISPFLYPIIVAVSVITTFTTPYSIKMAVPAYDFVVKRIPERWDKLLVGYASSNYSSVNSETTWRKLLNKVLKSVASYSTLTLAVMLICNKFLIPFIINNIPNVWGRIISAVLALIVMAPFLRAIMVKKNRSKEFLELWNTDTHFNKGVLISLVVFRACICIVFVLMVLIPLFPEAAVLMCIIALFVILFILYSQGFRNQSRRMEARFIENLTMKDKIEAKTKAVRKEFADDLLSKNVHIEDFILPQTSVTIGKKLSETNFKQRTGVNIVKIIRGGQKINIPDGNEVLYPFDKLVVVGTDEELQSFEQMIEDHNKQAEQETVSDDHYIVMSQYTVTEDSPIIGKSLMELKLREQTECMVIAIDRNEHAMMNVDANTILKKDDVLWIAGEKDKTEQFGNKMESIIS